MAKEFRGIRGQRRPASVRPKPTVAGRVGDLAYLDSVVDGLVPCKVIGLEGYKITIRITATRGAYARGREYTFLTTMVCPRSAVYGRQGRYMIRPYQWVEDTQDR